MKIKYIIFSWDFILAAFLTFVAAPFFVFGYDYYIFKDVSIKIADTMLIVLSILFPLFFAALTIIITASDDMFAQFLISKGYYQVIISTFKFTLTLDFIALLFSIILSVSLKYLFLFLEPGLNYTIVSIYLFIILYALFSTFNSIMDSIKYAQYRGKYFKMKNNNN